MKCASQTFLFNGQTIKCAPQTLLYKKGKVLPITGHEGPEGE
jgi:hypothetical protein